MYDKNTEISLKIESQGFFLPRNEFTRQIRDESRRLEETRLTDTVPCLLKYYLIIILFHIYAG